MSQYQKILDSFEKFIGVNILYQTVDGELFVDLADAQSYTVSLISSIIVPLNRPTTLPSELLPYDGKWVFLPNGSANVLQKNLITNGFGELGGLVNFSKFKQHIQNDFVEFQLGANYRGEQAYIVDGKAMLMTDSLIPIVPGQVYCLEFNATTLDAFGQGELYSYEAGVAFFDADGVLIENNFVNIPANNLRLKKSLKTGDTYLVTKDQPDFVYGAGTDTLRNIAFLDHTFKNGRRISTYTRNVLKNAYPANNHIQVVQQGPQSDIRLMLNQPYVGVDVPANTRIANVKNEGFHCVKTSGMYQGSGENTYRVCFSSTDESPNSFNISRYAKYMKFFVQQTSEAYFDLLLSDISLKPIYPGDEIQRIGGPQTGSTIPSLDAGDVPNGFRYRAGNVLYESFDGQWVQYGYTPLIT